MCKNCLKFDPEWFKENAFALTILAFMATAFVLSQLYKEDLVGFGRELLIHYHEKYLYVLLFTLPMLSSTLFPLPVFIYVMTSVMLGFPVVKSCIMVGLGSSFGSFSSYLLGRYFSHTPFVARKLRKNSKANLAGKSRLWAGSALFFGTVSPMPMDVLYVTAGLLRYPWLPFLILVAIARIIRYTLMGILFSSIY